MAISTHKEGCIEYITDSNKTKHYLNAEYLDGHSYADIESSVANHYTPAADSSAQLSVDASSTTAATWDKTALVTGVNLQRDSKGHVTGVTVDSIKMPANPNTHQAIKTLKTDNTAPQPTSASEAIAGTGTINLHKVAKTGSYSDLNDKPTNLVTTDAEQTVTGTKHFNAITANTIGTGSDANNYFQSQKFRGEGDANTYYHAVDFGYAGHNQVDFYEYGGNYNFYINTQANTDSRQLLFGINPSGIKIPTVAGAKVLGTNADGQVESHSLGIADISSLQSTLDGKVNSSSLATVAKTGSYNDLSNKPTIPDISGLVPYTGASKDVNLGKHSLSISDKTDTSGTMIKVSGKGISEDDVWTTIEPYGITMADPGIIHAELSSSALTVSDGAQSCSVTENWFNVTTPEGTSGYGYDEILHDGKHLSLPEKSGTIALTSDINKKQNSSAFLNLIADTDISNNKLGFLRVYMKPIETPGITHYMRAAELQDLPLASSSEYGTVKLGSDDAQTVPAEAVSSATFRTYAIQKDSNGNLVVNVPWFTPNATYDTRGIVYLGRAIHIDGTGYATNGYYYDRNSDIQICFGTTQKSNGLISVTFARRFKGAPTVVLEPFFKSTTSTSIGTQYRNAQTVRCYLVNGSATTSYSKTNVVTGFHFDSGNNEDQYFNYIAIGQSASDEKYDNPTYEEPYVPPEQ